MTASDTRRARLALSCGDSRLRSLATCALLALPAGDEPVCSPSDQWPGFRGVGSGWTSASDLPVEATTAWTADLAAAGQSSPVVMDGKVFATSVDRTEDEERLNVQCFRLEDGEELWSRSFEASIGRAPSEMISLGAPTPVVGDGLIHCFFESGDLITLDFDGNEEWRHDLLERFGPFLGNHGVASSPVRHGSTVMLLLDHEGPSHLVALDAASGEDRWVIQRPPRVSWTTPVLVDDELVVSSNGIAQGFAVEDGTLRWSIDGIEGNTVPSPTAVGSHVVIGQSKGDGLTLLRRPSSDDADAETLWAARGLAPSGFGSPLVYRNSALLLNKAGVLHSVSLETGELEWRERLSCGSTWASPIAAGDRIWFFGKDGTTSVVRWAPTGPEELFTCNLEVDAVYGTAAVSGSFLIRDSSRILCLRTDKGTPAEPTR